LREEANIKSIVGGDPKERILHESYVEALNMSKIAINSNCNWGQLNMKYTEAMACGCLLLTDKPKDFEKSGFVNRYHLVLFNGLDHMMELIGYYLEHENERLKIAKQGHDFAVKKYSTKAMAELFVNEVKIIERRNS